MPSRSLGTLTLDLIAKIGGFEQGLGRAERSIKKIEKAATGASRTIRNAFAVLGVGLGVRELISATVRQENAIRQLEARLKSTGSAAGLTSTQLQDLAISMQSVTTFGDEAVIELENLLLTFTNIRGDVFEKTTRAALDLSIAMGQDLKSSAVQLGKALNDPITGLSALSRVGVKFTDDQKDLIKALVESGRIEEAQRIILQELQTEFGGAAQAAADTFGGALTQVKNAFGDLLEAKGGLNDAKKGLQDLRDLLQDPNTKAGAEALANGIVTAFSSATKAITETINVVKFLAESLAAKNAGANYDDVVRSEERINSLIKEREDILKRIERAQYQFLEYQRGPAIEALTAQLKKVDEEIKNRQDAIDRANKKTQDLLKTNVSIKKPDELIDKPTIGLFDEKRFSEQLKADIKSLEEQAKAAKKVEEDYLDLVRDLRTEEEVLTDQARERFKVLASVNDITEQQRNLISGRIAGELTADAPDFSGGDTNKAQAELENWYATQLQLLDTFRKEQTDLTAIWDDEELRLKTEHDQKLAEIDQARKQAALLGAQSLFGNLADLAKQFAGESSRTYRALFFAEKAIGIARSIVAIKTGIAEAVALPFPENLAAMATVAAATSSIVSDIQGTNIVGQAHDGIDKVPMSGTWNLEKGERVTTQETSAKLDRTLDDVRRNQSTTSMQSPQVSLRNINLFDTQAIADFMSGPVGEQITINHVAKNQRGLNNLQGL